MTAGGYDCNFINNPPDELVCQICTLVAHHPYQTTCCGRVYCKRCIESYKRQNHEEERKFQCPNCRKRTQTFHDRRGSRNIQCLHVRCTYVQFGCSWEGELRCLEDHVMQCGYCQVPCPNSCSITVTRATSEAHLESECPLRKYHCRECNQLGTYRAIVTEHQDECPEVIIPCPNGCGFDPIVRRLLESHREVCPIQPVTCDYKKLGCNESIKRKELQYHNSLFLEHHLALAMKTILTLQQPLATFKLKDFAVHKSSKKWWYSPAFYTNKGGYKLCLGVMASGNGDGAGSHVSAYIYRMKGENDDGFVWPFRGHVTFELLNQLEDNSHMKRTVPFEFYKSNQFNSRVVKGERSDQGWGFNRLVSHDVLIQSHDSTVQSHDNSSKSHVSINAKSADVNYIKDDCMYFRIVSAEVCPTNKPWLMVTNNV